MIGNTEAIIGVTSLLFAEELNAGPPLQAEQAIRNLEEEMESKLHAVHALNCKS